MGVEIEEVDVPTIRDAILSNWVDFVEANKTNPTRILLSIRDKRACPTLAAEQSRSVGPTSLARFVLVIPERRLYLYIVYFTNE